MAEGFRVLLYYKFIPIENLDVYVKRHLKFCKALGLKGRILIAEEGINGTVSGTISQTDAYMHAIHMDPRFEDMVFKIDEVDGHVFQKLFVRKREQIIRLFEDDDVKPYEKTGKHLSPREWYKAMQDDDVIVIDGRNNYEYEIGHFRGAIRPPLTSFREFPKWVRENLEGKKDKKVLMYCTGGIRCEKLSGVFLNEGFSDVNQLDGGIVTYGKDRNIKGELWDGKCYVFDERISVPINQTESDRVVGKCFYCGTAEDRYVNCANPECNLQHVSCTACEEKHKRSCSDACRKHPRNRYKAVEVQ
jgi:UPF0176 protein